MFAIVWFLFKVVWRIASLLVRIAIYIIEGIIWLLYLGWSCIVKTSDAGKAAGSVYDGQLRCPRGHPVPLSGGMYECAECGFVYEGSILQCGNPECSAGTSYVNCPECGLSVRNPYRWGRP